MKAFNGLVGRLQRGVHGATTHESDGGSIKARKGGTAPLTTISAPYNVTVAKMTAVQESKTRAVTVFCGSSTGKDVAYTNAAKSLGKALAEAGRPLVYGGGSSGIMGAVSGAALDAGGDVTGVVPFAMVAAGGEVDVTKGKRVPHVILKEKGREKAEVVVVNSMHERKADMAKRSCAFFGLPGGYGTFEEVLEVTCWSQLGIHSKPVILLNIHGFWNPLRDLVRNGIAAGFIQEHNEKLIRYVDGPEDRAEHADFDWGKAGLEALDQWESVASSFAFNWHLRKDGKTEADILTAV